MKKTNQACTALLWQKEASDKPSKSELLIFHISPSVLFFQAKFMHKHSSYYFVIDTTT